ncbi:rCG49633 [Rattus norvegicus]|uniref:RCG49633 n=1 Tax=Rattus norvegicus TaxID=10116 RepID=A6K2E0_RAT|nr:rCG49633 [Rattus norvegicus]
MLFIFILSLKKNVRDCSTSISLVSLLSIVNIRFVFFHCNKIIICQNLLNSCCL